MSIDYIFCDHCIKNITNKRQLIGKETEFFNNSENLFCSRKCEANCNYKDHQRCLNFVPQIPLGHIRPV